MEITAMVWLMSTSIIIPNRLENNHGNHFLRPNHLSPRDEAYLRYPYPTHQTEVYHYYHYHQYHYLPGIMTVIMHGVFPEVPFLSFSSTWLRW